jgi:hypothetical protein
MSCWRCTSSDSQLHRESLYKSGQYTKKRARPWTNCNKRFFGFKSFIGSQTTPEKKSPIIGPREMGQIAFWIFGTAKMTSLGLLLTNLVHSLKILVTYMFNKPYDIWKRKNYQHCLPISTLFIKLCNLVDFCIKLYIPYLVSGIYNSL